jgi:hypothetical protein
VAGKPADYTLNYRLGDLNWKSVAGVGMAGALLSLHYILEPSPLSIQLVVVVHCLTTCAFLNLGDVASYACQRLTLRRRIWAWRSSPLPQNGDATWGPHRESCPVTTWRLLSLLAVRLMYCSSSLQAMERILCRTPIGALRAAQPGDDAPVSSCGLTVLASVSASPSR